MPNGAKQINKPIDHTNDPTNEFNKRYRNEKKKENKARSEYEKRLRKAMEETGFGFGGGESLPNTLGLSIHKLPSNTRAQNTNQRGEPARKPAPNSTVQRDTHGDLNPRRGVSIRNPWREWFFKSRREDSMKKRPTEAYADANLGFFDVSANSERRLTANTPPDKPKRVGGPSTDETANYGWDMYCAQTEKPGKTKGRRTNPYLAGPKKPQQKTSVDMFAGKNNGSHPHLQQNASPRNGVLGRVVDHPSRLEPTETQDTLNTIGLDAVDFNVTNTPRGGSPVPVARYAPPIVHAPPTVQLIAYHPHDRHKSPSSM
eukprot:1428249-Rhodomonas_salina.2